MLRARDISLLAGCLCELAMEAIKKKLASLKQDKEAAVEDADEAKAQAKEAEARADAVSDGLVQDVAGSGGVCAPDPAATTYLDIVH